MTTIRRALITITCTAVMVAASFPTVSSAATFAPDTNTVSGNSLRPSTRATSPAPRASHIAIKIKAGRTKTVSFAGVSGLPPRGNRGNSGDGLRSIYPQGLDHHPTAGEFRVHHYSVFCQPHQTGPYLAGTRPATRLDDSKQRYARGDGHRDSHWSHVDTKSRLWSA